MNLLGLTHTTKDGKVMRIAEMDTPHLLNTIRLELRKANEVLVASRNPGNRYTSRLYGRKSITPEEAADTVNEVLAHLLPYVFEAFFRYREIPGYQPTMENILELLISVMHREGQLPPMTTDLLTSGSPASLHEDDERPDVSMAGYDPRDDVIDPFDNGGDTWDLGN